MSATIQFWLLFGLLNSMYFVPRYLLEIFHSGFFPVRDFTHGTLGQRLRHLLIRPNYDIFRVCIDFFVLSIGYVLLFREWVGPVPYAVILSVYYLLSLAYQLYFHGFHRIYHLDPVFFHDFLMLKTAGQIFIHEYGIRNLIMTLSAMVFGVLAVLGNYALTLAGAQVTFGSGSYWCIGVCGAGSLYSVVHYSYTKYPRLTFQSPLQSLIRNIRISFRSKKSVAALTLNYMTRFNAKPDVQLTMKPNIYLIVVESYGRMLFEQPGMRDRFIPMLHTIERQLSENAWQMASAFSSAPVTGGASWISYTSLMYGLNVRNQGVYTTMLKNIYMQKYDSLFHWLKRQGYQTFRISSLGGYESMEIPYDSYSRLYGVDHWIKYKDLAYHGEHYGFGPSPPDQYALWKGTEHAEQIAAGLPRAIFFITQNSHTPYDSPHKVADDWRSLSDGSDVVKKPSAFWSRPKFEKYGEAMQYQLQFLSDFILRHGREDDVFILAGDHQPPSLSQTIDNFDTPIHVISKQRAFVDAWSQYGFNTGMLPVPGPAGMQHAGFHWAMLRTLIGQFGVPGSVLPEYLPEGIAY